MTQKLSNIDYKDIEDPSLKALYKIEKPLGRPLKPKEVEMIFKQTNFFKNEQ